MSLLRIDLDVADAQGTVDGLLLLSKGGRGFMLDQLAQYLDRLASGNANFNSGKIVTGAVKASGTVTFSGVPTAGDTVTANGVVFTAVNSGATGNQFNVGASAAAAALNLKNAINASASAAAVKVIVCTVNGA